MGREPLRGLWEGAGGPRHISGPTEAPGAPGQGPRLSPRHSPALLALPPPQALHSGLLRQRSARSLHGGAEQPAVEGEDAQLHQTGNWPGGGASGDRKQALGTLPRRQLWSLTFQLQRELWRALRQTPPNCSNLQILALPLPAAANERLWGKCQRRRGTDDICSRTCITRVQLSSNGRVDSERRSSRGQHRGEVRSALALAGAGDRTTCP